MVEQVEEGSLHTCGVKFGLASLAPPTCPTMVSCLHLIHFVTGGKSNEGQLATTIGLTADDFRPNGRRLSA